MKSPAAHCHSCLWHPAQLTLPHPSWPRHPSCPSRLPPPASLPNSPRQALARPAPPCPAGLVRGTPPPTPPQRSPRPTHPAGSDEVPCADGVKLRLDVHDGLELLLDPPVRSARDPCSTDAHASRRGAVAAFDFTRAAAWAAGEVAEQSKSTQNADIRFNGRVHLRVRLAGGEVPPLRPWLGDGAKWVGEVSYLSLNSSGFHIG